jgi:hypothetical protein
MEFSKFWFKNEPNIMHFESLSKQFLNAIIEKLNNDSLTILREDFMSKAYNLKESPIKFNKNFIQLLN